MTPKWWQTYPRELWTDEDRRAAREDGWRPPSSEQLYQPIGDTLPVAPPRQALAAGWFEPRESLSDRADKVLEKFGVKKGRRR